MLKFHALYQELIARLYDLYQHDYNMFLDFVNDLRTRHRALSKS